MHVIQIDALMPPFLFFLFCRMEEKSSLVLDGNPICKFFYNSYAHFNVHEEVDIWYGFA